MELSRALSLLSANPAPSDGKGRLDPEQTLSTVGELIGISEVLHGDDQAKFIQAFVPWALLVLAATSGKMLGNSNEHRIRHGILLIVKNVCCLVDPMKPFLADMMTVLLGVLDEDNEENGILAIHILIDLHKLHRLALEPYAQPLIDYVLVAFENFSSICEAVFENAKKEERNASAPSSRRNSTKHELPILKASCSFKVLIECPVMVVLLFQIHRRLVTENINKFVPLVIQTLGIQMDSPNPPSPNHHRGLESIGQVSPQHAAYADYISGQVKTLSFLAYISRGFASIIRPHYAMIPSNVIRLLRSCPSDSASARKELLVATRHILSTEIRQAFVPFLDELLDEGLLLGEGYTSFYVLRPLALSMLADLVHHVRTEISLAVLAKIIRIYSQSLHDPSLPVGVQTMSAKLLVNLVDSMLVEALGPLPERRASLLSILYALMVKFDSLAILVEELKGQPDPRQYSPFFEEVAPDRPVDTDIIAMDPNRDNFRDFKFLLKTLIGGLKNVIFALKTISPPESQLLFSMEEGKDFLDLFQNGIKTFDLFRIADETTASPPVVAPPSPKSLNNPNLPDSLLTVVAVQSEEKEIYEQFAYIFTTLDPHLFQDVFAFHLEELVALMVGNHSLLIIPQYFLAISGVSRNFAGLLIKYLMDHFDDLVSQDLTKGAVSLRLFKLLFLAVSVYPDENESVLQPHLTEIIMNCLKRYQHTPRSLNYFLLLRSLFRSIGGGRFDALYKEVLPLLPVILEELGKLPIATSDPVLRELYVELCLTTPVRLSVLLPYLSHLMKPLVLALQSSSELISQGLRTLELCIDNLTQDFLEPIVFPILNELLDCLWALLKPPPANQAHSHAAMRILGKMGGRSHRYLPLPKPIPYESACQGKPLSGLALKFGPENRLDLPLDQVILSAAAMLHPSAKVTGEQRQTAFELIASNVKYFFTRGDATAAEQLVNVPFESQRERNPQVSQELSQEVQERLQRLTMDNASSSSSPGVTMKLTRSFCEKILSSLFWACTFPELSGTPLPFLLDFYTLLAATLVFPAHVTNLIPSTDIFVENIINMACDLGEGSGFGIVVQIIERLHAVNQRWCPQSSLVLTVVLEKLITACYWVKAGEKITVIRLIRLVADLEGIDLAWLWTYEVRLTRGFLYAMKSFTPGLVSLHGSEVTESLTRLLRICNRQNASEPAESKARRVQYFNQLVTLLVSEISNSNALVRTSVQSCFQLLADMTGSDVTELLLPLKDRLLAPIFTKPLRALPPNLQIGYIDAISYCLSLRPPLMEVNDELLRLLNEAIALSEADDSFLATKTNQIATSASILQLRLVCIHLLSMALSTSEFQTPKLQPIRNMIVAVFFKSLYSHSPEVVEASRLALEQVMVNQHKLPKDLLQTALRPVLTNLAEAKRLTLPGLDGLRRVLELLTSYFKAEIGKKLLDHLSAWSEPKKPLQDASARPLCESMEVRVIASILDIFHLLPSSGHVFVSELIVAVIGLERLVLRSSSSPFRPPLQRLLAHYPEESVEYFLEHAEDMAVVELFAHVIESSESIVEAFLPRCDRLMRAFEAARGGVRFEMIRIMEKVLLSDQLPKEATVNLIRGLWRASTSSSSQQSGLKEARAIYRLAAKFIRSQPSEYGVLLLMISIFDYSFMAVHPDIVRSVKGAVQQACASRENFEELVRTWCEFHAQRAVPVASKIKAVRMLLLPCLRAGASMLTPKDAELIIAALGSAHVEASHEASMLAVEEIQVATALLAHASPAVAEQLYHLLLAKAFMSDPSVKFSAYCGIVRFLGQMKEESIEDSGLLQILPSFLKMPTSETRPVVRQALDLLFNAVIPEASIHAAFAQALGQVIQHESYSTVLVSVVWQGLLGLGMAADGLLGHLFRLLCTSFLRSAQSIYMIVEHRMLPFEILGLMAHRMPEQRLSAGTYEGICSLAMKLLMSLAMSDELSPSLPQALEAFGAFVRAYSEQPVALPWAGFDKVFTFQLGASQTGDAGGGTTEDSTSTGFSQQQPNHRNALRLVLAILQGRSLAERSLDFEALGPSLLHLLRQQVSSPVALELLRVLELAYDCIRAGKLEGLAGMFASSAIDNLLMGRPLACSLLVLEQNPKDLEEERILNALLRQLPRLAREHISKMDMTGGSNAEHEFTSKHVLIPLVRLVLRSNAEAVRGPALLAITLLWERSLDRTVLMFLIDLFINWFGGSDSQQFFSNKEVSEVLLTETRLEQMNDEELLGRYLDLVLTIYSNPQLTGSELTNRLEGSFLQGLAVPGKRDRFMALLNASISADPTLRLQYALGGIRWNLSGSFNWIPAIIDLLFLGITEATFNVPSVLDGLHVDDSVLGGSVKHLCLSVGADKLLAGIKSLLVLDAKLAARLWEQIFTGLWAACTENDKSRLAKALSKLLAGHESLASLSSGNPIYQVVAAAAACERPPRLPAHLLRFVAQSHKTWYGSALLLESQLGPSNANMHEASQVAAALYKDLAETDMMYGTLRRVALYPESSAALSFAEANKWALAQRVSEGAQEAVRTGSLPYADFELACWEEVWMESAKKLQQWDLVTEVAKFDSDADLNLECIWRLGDWLQPDTTSVAEGLLKASPSTESPRSKFLQSFLILNEVRESGADRLTPRFQTALEEAIQGTLRAWNLLPDNVSRTHVGMLHMFQMFVEIQEAMTIYSGISGGPANPASLINRPQFLTDLKGLLSTWRERLPNRMDDLNTWSDLLAWRQHIFSALNAAFQTPGQAGAEGAPAAATAASHPFAYRGYHELAWLINKFSRVCRKNGLPETCLSFLNRIYTLPNIEIQDAFSKLREQTLCYLDSPADLPTALEVINATNLNYFSAIQKAEFFAMKALILSRLGLIEEANRVFAQAVQIDLNIGKGWAWWGQFNDQRFQQTHDITLAVSAINCYLQASTLFKIAKARRFGARILWLLTFEDASGSIAKSFELYNNDLPAWFWVPFIPQLLSSLARKEAKLVRFLLIKLAKTFPQALYLPLRTAGDEFRAMFGGQKIPSAAASVARTRSLMVEDASQSLVMSEGQSSGDLSEQGVVLEAKRNPIEYTDDLLAILKTGYPLLSLSMENMVEHIVQRLRSTADEDLFRVVVTLLSEAFQQMMIRFNSAAEGVTGNGMESSLKRVSFMLGSSPYLASTYKKAFDEDFGNAELSLDEVIALLQAWRTNLERVMAKCPTSFSLESLSRFLAEFEYQRYDDVEMPGQYLLLKDNNNDFVKIDRFEPIVEIVRRHGSSFRRISLRASNGTIYKYVVQNPSARQSRREEKIMQFFRFIQRSLKQNPNSRRRGLDFDVPVIVPVSAHVRLIQDESDQVTLEEVYDRYCAGQDLCPEDVLIHYRDQFQAETKRLGIQLRKGNVEVLNLRVDLFQQISQNLVPSSILEAFFRSVSPSPDKYWIFRQAFARQYAGSIFLSYVLALGHRYPHKLAFSLLSGSVSNMEILPTLNPNGQITLVEAVPFRLTPNLQEFLTPVLVEGILTPAIHSYAEVFYRPDSELCEFLPMIIRDELISWALLNQPSKPRFLVDEEGCPVAFKHDLEILEQLNIDERQFLGRVIQNCELAMKRCQTLACIKENEKAGETKAAVYQTILDLVSCATNPQKLALMDAHWHPWL